MMVKIISDGTAHGTRVENMETGEPLTQVTAIQWRLDVGSRGFAEVDMRLIGVPVELVGEVKEPEVEAL